MKKYILLGLVFALIPFVSVKAETLTCEVGQKVESVLVTPATPAVTEWQWVRVGWRWEWKEVVITPAVDAVYEDQCVVDTEYVAPAPVVKAKVQTTVGGSSVFRKLCNLNTLFGVGFCPVQDPSKGVEYASLYAKLIEELKAR